MKPRIVYIFTLLLIAFCVNAQESKYFEMDKRVINTFFNLKGSVPPEIKKSGNKPVRYYYDFNKNYFKKASAIFKDVFKDTYSNQELFDNILYVFFFDKDYQIVYYTLKFPTKRLSEFPAMEEDLVRFAQLIEEKLNIRSYIKSRGTLNGGNFQIALGALASYLKDPAFAETYQKNNN